MDTNLIVLLVLVGIESFLLGSIPFGVIVGKVFHGADPRDGGSHSIGATNMNRLFGWKAALATFIGDVGKGALAVGIARIGASIAGITFGWQFDLALVLAVLLSICGHMFSPWLHFKGGKGISTGLGSIMVMSPAVALTILAVFLVVAISTKMVSAGSICAAIAFPIASCFFHWGSIPIIALAVLVAIAVVYAHRGNIQRIIAGEEPTFSFNRSSGSSNQ